MASPRLEHNLPMKRVRERSAEEVIARKAKKIQKRMAATVAKPVGLSEERHVKEKIGSTTTAKDVSSAVWNARLSTADKLSELAANVQKLATRLPTGALREAGAAYVRARRAKPWPLELRPMQRTAALDSLYCELWGFSSRGRLGEGRRGQLDEGNIVHPAKLAEAALAQALTIPGVDDSLRQVVRRCQEVARRWGLKKAWLSGGQVKMWKPGACALQRLLRARWCEACCFVARQSADTKEVWNAEARATLLRWQFAARDGAARWLSFAIPSVAALRALSKFVDKDELVELGAHNGYWASLLSFQGIATLALDIAPPPHAPTVSFGTAENLRGLSHGTLLLCMPPPGEPGCAEQALDAFEGDRVAYVGEWGTGMTGTMQFHKRLLQEFLLEKHLLLPCCSFMRVELFLFRRRTQKVPWKVARVSSPLACDSCGNRNVPLWQCPWTRQVRVCSEACFTSAHELHLSVLLACYCGAHILDRPSFASWQQCTWLDQGSATEAQWNALREATPQSEIGRGKGTVRRKA